MAAAAREFAHAGRAHFRAHFGTILALAPEKAMLVNIYYAVFTLYTTTKTNLQKAY
jgi:hypothetical protein